MTTAWTRSRRPSLVRTRDTYVLTISGVMNGAAASPPSKALRRSERGPPVGGESVPAGSPPGRPGSVGEAQAFGEVADEQAGTAGASNASPRATVRIPSTGSAGVRLRGRSHSLRPRRHRRRRMGRSHRSEPRRSDSPSRLVWANALHAEEERCLPPSPCRRRRGCPAVPGHHPPHRAGPHGQRVGLPQEPGLEGRPGRPRRGRQTHPRLPATDQRPSPAAPR